MKANRKPQLPATGGPPRSHGSISDELVKYGVIGGTAAGALAWTSGQLAGLVFGQDWLHINGGELAEILVKLPFHLSDPAQAWPADAQAELPGPLGMYGSAATVLAGSSYLAAKAIEVKREWRHWRYQPRQTRWGATWATPRNLRQLLVSYPQDGRVVLGRPARRGLARAAGPSGRLLAAEDCHSVLLFGPPGSGKTFEILIPAVNEWRGPVVATSVKLDVVQETRAIRERLGEVVVLDPLGLSGEPAARWSPLAYCGTYHGAQAVAAAMAATVGGGRQHPGRDDNHRYWVDLAAKLLAPVLYAASTGNRSMSEVLHWIDQRDIAEVSKLLEESGNELALDALDATWRRAEKALDSVYSTAEDLLKAYYDERVATFTDGHDLDIDRFLGADNTLYLYAPVHEQERLRPLFETITAQLLRSAQERAATQPGGRLDPRLLLALDEAGNVAALHDLPQLATTGRGQGIQLLTVWHDLGQLRDRYGERANTVVNGHRAKVFLSGLADPNTLELASKLIGDEALRDRSYTRGLDGKVSVNESTSWRPLAAVDELRRLAPREAIVVYGHHKPTKVQLRPWYEPREQRAFERAEAARDQAELRRRVALQRAEERAERWQQRRERAAASVRSWLQRPAAGEGVGEGVAERDL